MDAIKHNCRGCGSVITVDEVSASLVDPEISDETLHFCFTCMPPMKDLNDAMRRMNALLHPVHEPSYEERLKNEKD